MKHILHVRQYACGTEAARAIRVQAALWNLLAAILCTIAAGIATVALYMSEPTFVNHLSAIGSGIGTLGGMAWIVAAAIGVRQS
ncbi:MAG TPA: hypothetical protein VFQ87_02270 [Bradyrhizobium sp.]|nr:hypothetical protein [Bradyrhizobium sp.]